MAGETLDLSCDDESIVNTAVFSPLADERLGGFVLDFSRKEQSKQVSIRCAWVGIIL